MKDYIYFNLNDLFYNLVNILKINNLPFNHISYKAINRFSNILMEAFNNNGFHLVIMDSKENKKNFFDFHYNVLEEDNSKEFINIYNIDIGMVARYYACIPTSLITVLFSKEVNDKTVNMYKTCPEQFSDQPLDIDDKEKLVLKRLS